MTDKHRARIQMLVDALRSGKYNQGTRALRNEYGYCCLGVACELYRKTTRHGKWEKVEGTSRYKFAVGNKEEEGYLLKNISRWFGFGGEQNPLLTLGKECINQKASLLNDDYRMPFARIADAFESTYLKPPTP